MADNAQFFHDTREPHFGGSTGAVTLATTYKGIFPAGSLPTTGPQYFARIGKKVHIRIFGQITTVLTPGNIQIGLLYGTGADNNGTIIVQSAVQTLIASQTNIPFEIDLRCRCVTTGATGTLWGVGRATFGTAVVAAGTFLIPGSAPAVSAAVDLTSATLFLSPQILRSGSTAETIQIVDFDYNSQN